MLANFFGKSNPINFVIIIGFFFCCFFIAVFNGFQENVFGENPVLTIVGMFILFLSILYFFHSIVTKSKLTVDNSYALLLFVIFFGFFSKELLEFKTVILFLLHILFLKKLYSLRYSKTIFQTLFDGGLFLGVLFILEPFSIIYIVLLYIAIYLYYKMTVRIIGIPILGFIVPLIFYATYHFWQDTFDSFLNLFYFLPNHNEFMYLKDQFLIPLLFIIFCVIASLILKTPLVIAINNKFRKSWILLIFNVSISLCFVLILPQKNGSELLFILFPTAIIVANGIETIANTVLKDVILVSLILCSLLAPFLL
ncbi:MAG: DUF6427 family protein [Polaribacter sp.]